MRYWHRQPIDLVREQPGGHTQSHAFKGLETAANWGHHGNARDGVLVFARDHLFPGPSLAAIAVIGTLPKDSIEWEAADGKAPDEVKR